MGLIVGGSVVGHRPGPEVGPLLFLTAPRYAPYPGRETYTVPLAHPGEDVTRPLSRGPKGEAVNTLIAAPSGASPYRRSCRPATATCSWTARSSPESFAGDLSVAQAQFMAASAQGAFTTIGVSTAPTVAAASARGTNELMGP